MHVLLYQLCGTNREDCGIAIILILAYIRDVAEIHLLMELTASSNQLNYKLHVRELGANNDFFLWHVPIACNMPITLSNHNYLV